MKIITISGAHAGVGKTALVCKLLGALKGYGVIKTTVSGENISVTSKKEAIEAPGKDTALAQQATGEKVILVSSPREELGWALKVALGMVRGCEGVIIEGTSVLEHLRPDIAIFIKTKGRKMKESATAALKKVDLVIFPDELEKAVKFVKEKLG
jgi:molybdopterin-guanine dinucleotide biosynthesis protein